MKFASHQDEIVEQELLRAKQEYDKNVNAVQKV